MAGSAVVLTPDTTEYELVGSGTLRRDHQRDSEVVNHTLFTMGDGLPTASVKTVPVYIEGTSARDLLSKISNLVAAATTATRVTLRDGASNDIAYFDVAGFKEWEVRRWPLAGEAAVVDLVFIPKTPDWQTASGPQEREW